ncbi:MAG: FAD-dependent oxidoreductase [Chloroflexi bacterium]|nr:FAD-dependent oxidoreductase [Chloroflexota bacterium]
MTQDSGSKPGEIKLFPHLFSHIQIRHLTIRNRIVNTAHGTRYADEEHLPSEKHVYYHMERAKGGVGLIIMEGTGVHPSHASASGREIRNLDDRIIPRYQMLTEAVHKYGAKMGVELSHGGRQMSQSMDYPVFAPSSVPTVMHPNRMPRQMDKRLIRELEEAFARAALRCKLGGMDLVELHGAHGNLVHQFISSFSNRRTDEYGGSMENRLRFAIETLTAMRERVGSDILVGIRINHSELMEGGLTITETQEVAGRLEESGLVDYLNVSQGHLQSLMSYVPQSPDMSFRPAPFINMAAQIKRVVKLPIIASGRINHPAVAEEILSKGQADMVGMVRALIADPHLPNKAREGRVDDIRLCVGAMEGCIQDIRGARSPVTCVQNPVTSREKDWAVLVPAKTRKHVVIVGGGPAGMECARVAALREHRITLFEKSKKLGGQVLIAAKAPGREEFAGIVDYLKRQIEKLGVEIRMGVEAKEENVLSLSPDAVVVATGCLPVVPSIPGKLDGDAVTPWDILEAGAEVGKRVIVWDEVGSQEAFGAAEHLASRGRKVEFVTRLAVPGGYINPNSWRIQYQRMIEMGVVFTPFTYVKRIDGDKVVLSHEFADVKQVREGIDAIVLAVWNKPQDKLYCDLEGKVKELYLIGDALSSRGVMQAFYDANKVARAL